MWLFHLSPLSIRLLLSPHGLPQSHEYSGFSQRSVPMAVLCHMSTVNFSFIVPRSMSHFFFFFFIHCYIVAPPIEGLALQHQSLIKNMPYGLSTGQYF